VVYPRQRPFFLLWSVGVLRCVEQRLFFLFARVELTGKAPLALVSVLRLCTYSPLSL